MATAMERKYQLAREQATTDVRAQTEQEKEALKRRFASIGGMNSGASIKAEQTSEREGARRLATGMNAITQQELTDQQRLEEVKQGQEFQTSERLGSQGFATGERLGSQGFAAGENVLNRNFQTSERLGSQGFQSGENALTRGQQASEFEKTFGLQNKEYSLKVSQVKDAWDAGVAQQKLAEKQVALSTDELELNKRISEANLAMAKDTAKIQKQQAAGGILGGIFGTGVGNASNFGTVKTTGKLGYFGF